MNRKIFNKKKSNSDLTKETVDLKLKFIYCGPLRTSEL